MVGTGQIGRKYVTDQTMKHRIYKRILSKSAVLERKLSTEQVRKRIKHQKASESACGI